VERFAEWLAGRLTRRGVLGRGLRATLGLGIGAAGLFGLHREALATQCTDYERSAWSCNAGAGYCNNHESNNGCNPRRATCTDLQCDAPATSNCIAPLQNMGYWDCCCDGNIIRCRDCGQNGQILCICSANIGSC
jgi:hypothetical protein